MRDFNSSVALGVIRLCPTYPGGPLWGRRYSAECLPSPDDIEKQFFYTVLQPVQDGLVSKISEYPFYNCFHDAVWGIERECEVVDWTRYHAALRYNRSARIKDYTEIVHLKYERIPGYEDLTQKEYADLMHEKLEDWRQKALDKRGEKGFFGAENLLQVVPGSIPMSTKKSTRTSHRPRVICMDPDLREEETTLYFQNYRDYKKASEKYRAGDYSVVFPEGMNKPYIRYHPPDG